MGFVCETERLQ